MTSYSGILRDLFSTRWSMECRSEDIKMSLSKGICKHSERDKDACKTLVDILYSCDMNLTTEQMPFGLQLLLTTKWLFLTQGKQDMNNWPTSPQLLHSLPPSLMLKPRTPVCRVNLLHGLRGCRPPQHSQEKEKQRQVKSGGNYCREGKKRMT